MCRINGIIDKDLSDDILIKMRDSLSYGGPDGCGIYVNDTRRVGLGHRRLSILELSDAGQQPMQFKDWVIVFNGEIYNYKEIAKILEANSYTFHTNSDTEVILKAIDLWGYSAVEKFRGMFSFALWNSKTQKLLLCRDRLGVKPLYWYLKDDVFMFASELKAFHYHPEFDKTINQEAVSLFLQTGYIPSPHCIFSFVKKLEPGSFLEIDLNKNIRKWKYWDVRDIYTNTKIRNESDQVLIDECEELLTESFKLRMVSDVPVGIFLSGGIDSSLVTTLLQKHTSTPLKTFTIGVEDQSFNEADFAKKTAKYLGTEHTDLYCNERYFEEIISLLPDIYDEPFGDPSAIPTYLVAKLAKESVSVALSADGADEIFTGYNRYLFATSLFNKYKKVPKWSRLITRNVINTFDISSIERFLNILPLKENYKRNLDARIPKVIESLNADTDLDFLYASTLYITENDLRKLHNYDKESFIFNKDLNIKENGKYGAFGLVDLESYLEGDILTKVDRATMQVALEGREPFLDHKIIEFSFTLADNLKIRNGKTKWILRQILKKHLPEDLFERPKMGFGIPLNKWLSTLLVSKLYAISEDKGFQETFMLDSEELKKIINRYILGKGKSPFLVWYIYCLYEWYLKWIR